MRHVASGRGWDAWVGEQRTLATQILEGEFARIFGTGLEELTTKGASQRLKTGPEGIPDDEFAKVYEELYREHIDLLYAYSEDWKLQS